MWNNFKVSFFFLLICLCTNIWAIESRQNIPMDYFLPRSHPLQNSLEELLNDPAMFHSPEHFKKAGFEVILGHRKLMVGSHPLIPDYMIKKFTTKKSPLVELENYLKRIKGAKKLQRYVTKHNFKHIVIPKKWIYPLPKHFKSQCPYVLVVEKMDVFHWDNDPNGKAKELYYNIDKEVLTELCTLLHDMNGCDAFPRNQPFTRTGQIAFIDTEHVGKFKGHFFKHVVPELNPEMQAYAIELWNHLERKQNKKLR